ncbi:MAG TPA: hypothetical protein VFY28_03340 [Candidatus Paceibacterota bacterium]|nr:hypothetical protein [Candidatus Paceibacterota bacterium]
MTRMPGEGAPMRKKEVQGVRADASRESTIGKTYDPNHERAKLAGSFLNRTKAGVPANLYYEALQVLEGYEASRGTSEADEYARQYEAAKDRFLNGRPESALTPPPESVHESISNEQDALPAEQAPQETVREERSNISKLMSALKDSQAAEKQEYEQGSHARIMKTQAEAHRENYARTLAAEQAIADKFEESKRTNLPAAVEKLRGAASERRKDEEQERLIERFREQAGTLYGYDERMAALRNAESLERVLASRKAQREPRSNEAVGSHKVKEEAVLSESQEPEDATPQAMERNSIDIEEAARIYQTGQSGPPPETTEGAAFDTKKEAKDALKRLVTAAESRSAERAQEPYVMPEWRRKLESGGWGAQSPDSAMANPLLTRIAMGKKGGARVAPWARKPSMFAILGALIASRTKDAFNTKPRRAWVAGVGALAAATLGILGGKALLEKEPKQSPSAERVADKSRDAGTVSASESSPASIQAGHRMASESPTVAHDTLVPALRKEVNDGSIADSDAAMIMAWEGKYGGLPVGADTHIRQVLRTIQANPNDPYAFRNVRFSHSYAPAASGEPPAEQPLAEAVTLDEALRMIDNPSPGK